MLKQKTLHNLTFTKFSDPSLPDFVKNIIEVRGHSRDTSVRLYPRNTPEILINLSKPIRGEVGSRTEIIKSCTIQGSKTDYVNAHHPKYCHFLSIRFTPNGFYKVLENSQKSFTNHVFNLEDVMGPDIERIIPALQQSFTVTDRFRILIKWLKKEFYKKAPPTKLLSDFIIGQLKQKPSLSVKQLAEKTEFTRKHLAHRFKEETGLTIKEYQKIYRFQLALRSIQDHEPVCWPTQAYQHGYYDQSHFIKDFKRYTGYTPTKFISPPVKV